MTALANARLLDLARTVLTSTDGSLTDSAVLAAALRRAYTNLSHVLIPLIGRGGTTALTARAVHLARREHPWLTAMRNLDANETVFEPVAAALAQQDPQVALEAATAVLATLAGLLVTFIGEGLTMRLVRQSWPDGFQEEGAEERPA